MLGKLRLYCEGSPELLFTENETNTQKLFNAPSALPYVKDAFHEYIVDRNQEAVNREQTGTKAAAHYALTIGAGESATIRLRLTEDRGSNPTGTEGSVNQDKIFGQEFDQVFAIRQQEADDFYSTVIPRDLSLDARNVMRQAFAGMLWSKQFYH